MATAAWSFAQQVFSALIPMSWQQSGMQFWAGFAEEIIRPSAARGSPSANIRHITMTEYPTKAKRPASSQLNCDTFKLFFGWKSETWQVRSADSTSAILPN